MADERALIVVRVKGGMVVEVYAPGTRENYVLAVIDEDGAADRPGVPTCELRRPLGHEALSEEPWWPEVLALVAGPTCARCAEVRADVRRERASAYWPTCDRLWTPATA